MKSVTTEETEIKSTVCDTKEDWSRSGWTVSENMGDSLRRSDRVGVQPWAKNVENACHWAVSNWGQSICWTETSTWQFWQSWGCPSPSSSCGWCWCDLVINWAKQGCFPLSVAMRQEMPGVTTGLTVQSILDITDYTISLVGINFGTMDPEEAAVHASESPSLLPRAPAWLARNPT